MLLLLQEVFDFPALRKFVARPDFSFTFDALHAVTGAYAEPLFVDELGGKPVRAAGRGGACGGYGVPGAAVCCWWRCWWRTAERGGELEEV